MQLCPRAQRRGVHGVQQRQDSTRFSWRLCGAELVNEIAPLHGHVRRLRLWHYLAHELRSGNLLLRSQPQPVTEGRVLPPRPVRIPEGREEAEVAVPKPHVQHLCAQGEQGPPHGLRGLPLPQYLAFALGPQGGLQLLAPMLQVPPGLVLVAGRHQVPLREPAQQRVVFTHARPEKGREPARGCKNLPPRGTRGCGGRPGSHRGSIRGSRAFLKAIGPAVHKLIEHLWQLVVPSHAEGRKAHHVPHAIRLMDQVPR
mmetsp:Transcript_4712/g.14031  ORF Transcript_4712/g.14031 Transcript_4712/m.14031 type:complete len:256 (+) Transcript_4712:999-1766(+)